MKIIKKGRAQVGWSKEFTCTGSGNGGGGCGAKLLVSVGDLYHTHRYDYGGGHDIFTTFTCAQCGVETDITDHSCPRNLPDKPVWLERQTQRQPDVILTTDAVVTLGGTGVVMIRRAKAPFQDKLVLPGGHVEEGEDVLAACVRELEEEVGLKVSSGQLKLLTVLDEPERDPRPGRRMSVVYHVALPESAREQLYAGSDAREIVVRGLGTVEPAEVGFDHWRAINMVARQSQ